LGGAKLLTKKERAENLSERGREPRAYAETASPND